MRKLLPAGLFDNHGHKVSHILLPPVLAVRVIISKQVASIAIHYPMGVSFSSGGAPGPPEPVSSSATTWTSSAGSGFLSGIFIHLFYLFGLLFFKRKGRAGLSAAITASFFSRLRTFSDRLLCCQKRPLICSVV